MPLVLGATFVLGLGATGGGLALHEAQKTTADVTLGRVIALMGILVVVSSAVWFAIITSM